MHSFTRRLIARLNLGQSCMHVSRNSLYCILTQALRTAGFSAGHLFAMLCSGRATRLQSSASIFAGTSSGCFHAAGSDVTASMMMSMGTLFLAYLEHVFWTISACSCMYSICGKFWQLIVAQEQMFLLSGVVHLMVCVYTLLGDFFLQNIFLVLHEIFSEKSLKVYKRHSKPAAQTFVAHFKSECLIHYWLNLRKS